MNVEQPNKEFSFREVVNSVEILCVWNENLGAYVINFPQITLGDNNSEKFIRISDRMDDVVLALAYIGELAKTDKDVHNIFMKSKKYCERASK